MNVSSRYLLRPFIHKSSVYLHFYDIIDRYTYFFRLQHFPYYILQLKSKFVALLN